LAPVYKGKKEPEICSRTGLLFPLQICNQKNYYVKVMADGVCLHLKIHKDFDNKLTLKGVQGSI
jgi:hypothetical protein